MAGTWMNETTNPDSVSLVQPPNTTIPKTLAALPRSQYATIFSVTSGNLEVLPELPIFLLKLVKGEDTLLPTAPADDETGCLMLKARANVALRARGHPFTFGFCLSGSDFVRHWRQVKNSRESRGPLNLNALKVRDAEAIQMER
jgi:hypothetical protein